MTDFGRFSCGAPYDFCQNDSFWQIFLCQPLQRDRPASQKPARSNTLSSSRSRSFQFQYSLTFVSNFGGGVRFELSPRWDNNVLSLLLDRDFSMGLRHLLRTTWRGFTFGKFLKLMDSGTFPKGIPFWKSSKNQIFGRFSQRFSFWKTCPIFVVYGFCQGWTLAKTYVFPRKYEGFS